MEVLVSGVHEIVELLVQGIQTYVELLLHEVHMVVLAVCVRTRECARVVWCVCGVFGMCARVCVVCECACVVCVWHV